MESTQRIMLLTYSAPIDGAASLAHLEQANLSNEL